MLSTLPRTPDEPFHSITSPARARIVGGTSKSRASAVLRSGCPVPIPLPRLLRQGRRRIRRASPQSRGKPTIMTGVGWSGRAPAPPAREAGKWRPAFDEFPRMNLVMIIIFDHAPSTAGGKQMIVDLESWEAGYDDGLRGRPSQCTPSLDRFSYSSGYFQARAYRKGTQEAPRYDRSSTQLAGQWHGASSRLIII
jgi:hypothetical protein